MFEAIDRRLVAIGVGALVVLCWFITPLAGGSLMTQATSATGLAMNVVALLGIAWGAPRIVDAVERQADATARLAAPSMSHAPLAVPTEEETDVVAEQLFNAYRRFLTRHPEFASGVSTAELATLNRDQLREYRLFMMRAVAFFAAIYDAAGHKHFERWHRAVASELDLHYAARRKWGDDLGTADLVPASE